MRRETQADLRDRIANGTIIGEIKAAERKVEELAQNEEPNKGRISAYRLLLDSKYRRLGKILPDLKAIEHSGPDGDQLEIKVRVVPHVD